MANKLVYTSAPKGLIPGSCGFCTVAGTRGMTKSVVDALEGLAGYRRVYETTDGCKTWHSITGDIGYRKPIVLRYNATTKELWAAGPAAFKLKR